MPKNPSWIRLDRVITILITLALIMLGWIMTDLSTLKGRVENNANHIGENKAAIMVLGTKIDLILDKLGQGDD